MDNFTSENPLQSVDEVDELIDEAFFSVSMMSEILQTGSDSQRMVILFELQQLLEHCFEDTVEVLVPVLCQLVADWTPELQISVAEALLHVVQKKISRRTSKVVCDAAFEVLVRTRTDDMFEAWGEILVVVLPNVVWTANNEISEVIAILDDFTTSSDEVCRKLVARVLGSFSSCLSTAEVETYVMKRALQLADDSDVEVRGMVSESLAFVGEVVDVGVVETCIWPKLLGLLKDPDARIHAATLKTIAHIAEVHKEHWNNSELYKGLLPPVFSAECDFARTAAEKDQRKVDDDTYLLLEIIAEVFGPFVYAVHPYLRTEAERSLAFDAFLAMATCNGPVVRRYCAFNFPGISKSLGDCFTMELSAIAEFLSRDADPETRWNLAAGMHETTRILMAKVSAENLFRTAASLLQDGNSLVRTNALEHFYQLISSLTEDSDVPGHDTKLASVLQNLRLFSGGNWRTQELLAKQLERVSTMIPPECLKDTVLPLLYEMAEESTYLVRKACMGAIAKAFWCLPFSDEREYVMNMFISKWAEGGVYWMRVAFVDCAEKASKLFSSELFNILFARPLFQLADDPVDNVRMRIARTVHVFAPLCFCDERYQSAVERLRNDTACDVRESMLGVSDRIANETKDKGLLEAEDKKRAAEEAEILQKAMQKKAAERRKAGRGKIMASALTLGRIGGKASNTPRQTKNHSFGDEKNMAPEPGSPVSVSDIATTEDKHEQTRSGHVLARIGRSRDFPSPGSGDADMPASPGRKSLRIATGQKADQQSSMASPKRSLKSLLSNTARDEDGPGPGNRKPFKNLLTRMGSGFKTKHQAVQSRSS